MVGLVGPSVSGPKAALQIKGGSTSTVSGLAAESAVDCWTAFGDLANAGAIRARIAIALQRIEFFIAALHLFPAKGKSLQSQVFW
jgi:hypothetical protein